jgi:YVTN family beta-propeller protein
MKPAPVRQMIGLGISSLVALLFAGPSAARADNCAFVATVGGSVSVIDISSESVVADVRVDGEPQAVAVDPRGEAVYVAVTSPTVLPPNADEDTASVLNVLETHGYTISRRIAIPGTAQTMVVSSDGRFAYVEDSANGGIDVVDLEAGAVVKRIRTNVHDKYDPAIRFALTPDGAMLVTPVDIYSLVGTIATIDTTSGEVVSTIHFLPEIESPGPVAVVLSPDGSHAFVGMEAGLTAEIDLASASVVDVFQVGSAALGTSPDGSRLHVARYGPAGDQLTTIDIDNNDSTGVVFPGYGEPLLALGPQGAVIYTAGSETPAVFAIDPAGQAVIAEIPVAGRPRDLGTGKIIGPCRPVAYTPPPTRTATATPTTTPVRLPTIQCAAGIPCLTVGSTSGRPGSEQEISVRLSTDGRHISAAQNDIIFDPHTVLHDCVQAASGSVAVGFRIANSRARAIVFHADGETMKDGEVLYTCRVTIGDDADTRSYPLLAENALGSDPMGNAITIATADGQVAVVEAAGARGSVGDPVSSSCGGCELVHQRSVGLLWLGIPIGVIMVRRLRMAVGLPGASVR